MHAACAVSIALLLSLLHSASAQVTGVYVLGAYNMGPWGLGWPDTGAVWIWNTAGAQGSAAAGVNINFDNTVTVASATTVTIQYTVDNSGPLYLNGVQIASNTAWNSPTSVSTTLRAGTNYISVVAQNAGGPAGFILSVIRSSDSAVLLHTDSSWTSCQSCNSPTDGATPLPTPQPTPLPTKVPTIVPTRVPTREPTFVPTAVPTPAVEMLGTAFVYYITALTTGYTPAQFCATKTRNGNTGYLATITTIAENDYVKTIIQGDAIIGGVGVVQSGTLGYRWRYGPEGQFNSNTGAVFFNASTCQTPWFCNFAISEPAGAGTLVIKGPGATLGQWVSQASPSAAGVVCKFTTPGAQTTCDAQQTRCTALQTTCTTSSSCASCSAFTTQCNSLLQSCNWLLNSCRAQQTTTCPF